MPLPAVSLLVLALLAQPVEHRVEVLGRGGDAFWATGPRGGDLWERTRGDVQLEARRTAEGAASAELRIDLMRGAERWTVELTTLRPGSLLIDADLTGPGGLIHAAVTLGGTARIVRAGEVITEAATLRAMALTTGFHADDGTFRSLPAGRSGDLELLVHVDDLPGGPALELGFEHPEIRLDGRALPAAPMADATAPPWPGARLGSGVGGSGTEPTLVLQGPVPSLVMPPASKQAGPTPLPATPAPANTAPATPLPPMPSPANSTPAQSLPATPAPTGAAGSLPSAVPLPSVPPLLPQSPAPANASPGIPMPATPPPANAAPALPLPAAPAPASAPGPVHGGTSAPGPTWFPAPMPPTPVPDEPLREGKQTRFARADSKIDPSGQTSTVRLRVQLRARALDLSRNIPRIALADRS